MVYLYKFNNKKLIVLSFFLLGVESYINRKLDSMKLCISGYISGEIVTKFT